MDIFWGTDEVAIFNLLDENYNQSDKELIWCAFGMRSYSGGGTALISAWGTDLNLGGWFNEELSGNDYTLVQQYFSNTQYAF